MLVKIAWGVKVEGWGLDSPWSLCILDREVLT